MVFIFLNQNSIKSNSTCVPLHLNILEKSGEQRTSDNTFYRFCHFWFSLFMPEKCAYVLLILPPKFRISNPIGWSVVRLFYEQPSWRCLAVRFPPVPLNDESPEKYLLQTYLDWFFLYCTSLRSLSEDWGLILTTKLAEQVSASYVDHGIAKPSTWWHTEQYYKIYNDNQKHPAYIFKIICENSHNLISSSYTQLQLCVPWHCS